MKVKHIFTNIKNPRHLPPVLVTFFKQVTNLEGLYNQLNTKYTNQPREQQKKRSLFALAANFICPDLYNTVPENSQRPDFLLLREIRKAMIHACKICLIPGQKGTPDTWTKSDYQRNIKDLRLLVPKLHGHASKSLQFLGVALFLLSLSATIFLALTICAPMPYFAIGIGVGVPSAITGCILIIFNRQKGLSKASDDLLKASLEFMPR